MDTKEQVTELFSMLHDGTVEQAYIENTTGKLTISIWYLAELIEQDFEYMHVWLIDVKHMTYKAWSAETLLLTEWQEIVNIRMEILRSEINAEGLIVIHTRCENPENPLFTGGEWCMDCADYQLAV